MTKMKDICPNCGSHLILKDGQFGEFLACPRFPECKYTRSLREVDELYEAPSLYCDKCSHTGLLPFVKNGKAVPYAFVDCECKLSLTEHYDPVRLLPSDFDFPCSSTFRAYQAEQLGEHLPPIDSPEPQPEVVPEIHYIPVEPELTKANTARQMRQLKGEVAFMRNKLNELSQRKTKRGRYLE